MPQVKVKPAKQGLLVRDPKSLKFLPAEGALVDLDTTYWNRRLRSGDIVIVEEAPAEPAGKKKN
jgi:hypothetical protein